MATADRTTKNDRIYIRLNENIKSDFEIVAHYRGLKVAALLHSLIVKTIHEEKENRPHIFANKNKDANQDAKKPKNEEKVSVNFEKEKAKKNDEFLKTGDGIVPLIDEASSTNDHDG